jgi:hypothetical protein
MRKGEEPEDKTPREDKREIASPKAGEETAEFPMPILEFAQTHNRGRDTELMGGFMHYAKQQGWVNETQTVWAERFEAFRLMPTA